MTRLKIANQSEQIGLLQYWQAFLRYKKHNEYPEHKFIIMMNQQFHPIVNDFITYTINLPDEFYALGLETDCYESPVAGSPSGSLTPPDVYAALIEYIRKVYNKDKAVELWTPRGYSEWVRNKPQMFTKYDTDRLFKKDKPFICVFPRARARAPQRNVPEFIWKETVDRLKNDFTVVLSGTPSGACLVDYNEEGVINLINEKGSDKLDLTMEYICQSEFTISSQSGPTHLSLLCGTPSYIIGHEKDRHTLYENRFATPTSFRYVMDYRIIDADTIIDDVSNFYDLLKKHGSIIDTVDKKEYDKILNDDVDILNNLLTEKQNG